MSEPLSQLATRVWQDRHAIASELVARGKWARPDADRQLMLFLVPCMLAGADGAALPEDVRDELNALREYTRYPGGHPARRSDAEARALFATIVAGPLMWSAALGDAAARAAQRCIADPTEDNRRRCMDLAALCRALDVSIPCLPSTSSQPERKAA
jgi:hypothetical protein